MGPLAGMATSCSVEPRENVADGVACFHAFVPERGGDRHAFTLLGDVPDDAE
jgi:hypothetical protein